MARKVNVEGCAVAQAVGARLPTAAARVRYNGICGGHSGICVGFLPVHRLPPIAAQSSSSIIRNWYNGPVCGFSKSGLGSTEPLEIIIIKNSVALSPRANYTD
jgi:hypothetical protein